MPGGGGVIGKGLESGAAVSQFTVNPPTSVVSVMVPINDHCTDRDEGMR